MDNHNLRGSQLVVPLPPDVQGERRPITPQDLLTIRDVNNVRISPDGSHIAFRLRQASLETNDYLTGWFVVGTERGSPLIPVGSAGEVMWDDTGQPRFDHAAHPVWSPDGQWIVYLLKADGEIQIWRSRADGSAQEQLTSNDADVKDFGFSPDGKTILFTTGAPRADLAAARDDIYDDGVVIDDTIRMSVGPPGPDVSKSPIGEVTTTWTYDLDTGTERPATDAERQTFEDAVRVPEITDRPYPLSMTITMSPQRDAVAFVAQTDGGSDGATSEGFAIYVKALPAGDAVELIRKPGFIVSLDWSLDASELYFTYDSATDGADGTSILAVSPATGAERRVLTSDYFLREASVARSEARMACVCSGLTEPDEVATIDLDTGELHVLTDLNPEFRSIRLSPAKRMTWTNKYGDEAFGHLVEPLDYQPGRRYPLVVTTYRSWGFLRGAVGDEYPIQLLAANGFFVLSFDRPRSYAPMPELLPPGTVQDFDLTIRHWDGPTSSLEEAVDKLVADGLVDPQRTGLCGLSNGAEITAYTISHSDRFHAASATTGAARNPFDYEILANHHQWQEIFKCWGVNGDIEDDESLRRWRMLSPALNADRIQAPLLVQPADTEYLSGLQLRNRLKALGKPVETIVYPDEVHIKIQPRHRHRVYERNVDWFNFWLQVKEDPDPSKGEQYRRWRALRANRETIRAAPSSLTTSTAP